MIKQINLGPTFKLLLMVLMMFTTASRTDHTFNPSHSDETDHAMLEA